jgi:hypothetical protein
MKSQNGSVNGRNGECGMEMGICGDVSNGDVSNGDVSNGDVSNGDVSNGDGDLFAE